MASKFFTWTKGDRRNAAEAYHSYRVDGLMPVDQYPIEHLQWDSPSDVALPKKRKKRHRPKPLQLAQAGCRNTVDASAFVPSSVLHETAITSVASASNLLAVVNDMLRSPAFNNPLPSPSRNPDPPSGRPRSHTAPPTPVIAELPGSILLENQGFPDEAKDPASTREDALALKRKTLASPFVLAAPVPNGPQHKKSLSLNTATSRWASGVIAGSSIAGNSRAHRPSIDSRSSGHRSSRDKRGDESEKSSLLRSPITEVTEASSAFAFAGSESSNAPSKHATHAPQVSENEQLKATIAAQNKKIATLKSQFQHLRISHEAHAASLAEAHRKELDAMQTYLHYIEASHDSRPTHPHLTIPTRGLRGLSPEVPLSEGKGKEPSSISDADAAETAPEDLDKTDRPAQERHGGDTSTSSADEEDKVETLKKKLDLAKKHLQTMKDQMELLVIRKDAYKDRAADLEVRVRNNHELLIDLREAEYKLEIERRLMHERHRQLKAEIEYLRSQPQQSYINKLEKEVAEEKQRADLLSTQLEAAQLRTPVPDTVAELTRTIDDLGKRLEEKEEQIYELQHVNKALHLDLEELDTQQTKLAAAHEEALAQEARKRKAVKERAKQAELENTELREITEAQAQDLVAVQDEYERLRKLLHSEMRSQAKESISRNLIPGTPSSTDGYLELVAVEARRRVQALIARENGDSSHQPAADPYERIEQLEREIQHHVNELIRCKRDNRGYKKDIKRANTKLDRMRNSMYGGDLSIEPLNRKPSLQEPFTPTDSPIRQKPGMAGLGISTTMLPSPATSAPSSQPTSAVTGNMSDSGFPLPNRPKTPVRSNTNKKLPPYPSLPEQVASQFPDNISMMPPPLQPSTTKDPPSRPKTPKTPTYKLTPTITRTPSINSIRPTPPPSAGGSRPSHHRFNTTTCFGSDTNPSSPAPGPPVPQRAGTQRSLSESIISSYANTTPPVNSSGLPGSAKPNSDADPDHPSARPKTPAKDHPPPQHHQSDRDEDAANRDGSAERHAVLAQALHGPPEIVDNTVGLTALPQIGGTGTGTGRPPSRGASGPQEEKASGLGLGLARKRSEGSGLGLRRKDSHGEGFSLRRKDSQDGLWRKMTPSRKSLGVEGVISRFNSGARGRSGSQGQGQTVSVVLEGDGGER